MKQKIDHLGIAVASLDESVPLFEEILGVRCMGMETVASQKVRTAFFAVGDVHLELLEATDSESPIARFMEKRGGGVHHVALAVENIGERLRELKAKGVRTIHDAPVPGSRGKQVAFLHPAATKGLLMELCSFDGDSIDKGGES